MYLSAGCWWFSSCVHSLVAGYGGLSLSIEGPSKAEIQCKDNEDGTLNISYKPTEPGYYIVNLKFADHHVEGSPFTVKVGLCHYQQCFLFKLIWCRNLRGVHMEDNDIGRKYKFDST
jgi:hypothetical protein